MKKTYLTPITEMVHVELQSMIASSPTGSKVFTTEDAGENVVGMARRNNSVWGDEEEDY